ncbi:MAG: hypothetical protein IJ680_05720 [Paludibacteraceae bacterium]|nr:hypothetical protein [Paludibacteraceae bacterium]
MAEYTEKQREQRREAAKRYTRANDRINVVFPAGTGDRIKQLGFESKGAFIKECVLSEIEKLEKAKGKK